MFVPVYLAALSAFVFYALLPIVGAFAVRNRWKRFRTAVAEAEALPPIGSLAAESPTAGSPASGPARYRAQGEVDAIGGSRELWVSSRGATCVVDLKDAWVYLLTGRSGDDVVERRRWSGLQSISPGARAFAAGRAELRGARMTMAPSGREPPLVVLHDGDDDAVVRRAVWAGRHDNEYWNPLTQVSIALGVAAMSAILPLALKAGIPSLIGALTLTAAFSPILPVLPPGVVFFFAYRRFWRRARYCRARRDTERLRGGDVADAWHRRAYGATAASALALAGALAVNGWLLIFVLRRFL